MSGFRVAIDEPHFEVTLTVRMGAGERMPTVDEMQDALTRVYAKAFHEASVRLGG